MPGPTPHYPPEFKREAVQLYRSSGESVSKIAQELGVSTESLRRWAKQHEIDEGERDGLTSQEREELRKLRRENRTLKPGEGVPEKSGSLLREKEEEGTR